jgi:hypothetical protein
MLPGLILEFLFLISLRFLAPSLSIWLRWFCLYLIYWYDHILLLKSNGLCTWRSCSISFVYNFVAVD